MNQQTGKSLLLYFLLAFALSLPFWLAGALAAVQLLPALPLSALSFLSVAAAAAIVTHRDNGSAGVKRLLKRPFDLKRVRSRIWYVPAVLLMPFIMLLSYMAMQLLGVPVPAPTFSAVKTIGLLVAFFVGALGEELGWSGYAIDPLQGRLGALGAGILLGVVWAIFHFVPLIEAHRSVVFVAWWSLGTVAIRILIVWLYNNTGGSVFVAALFHTTVNLTWQLFPVNGSFYDPGVTGPITAVAAALVVVVWGPRRLSRRAAAVGS